jgi:ribosomal protein S18 acetylase RimI-like enzyme
MDALSDEPVEHHRHAIAHEPIERMDPRAHHSLIRSAGVRDIAAVLDLWTAAGSVPTVGNDSPEGLTRLLAADPQALLVVEVEAVLAGSLIAAWDGWRGSFYRLAVAPEHRRKGLATRLLREGEQRLRERGAIRLTAIVAEDEAEAMRFWRAVGYERQQRRARFVRHLDG